MRRQAYPLMNGPVALARRTQRGSQAVSPPVARLGVEARPSAYLLPKSRAQAERRRGLYQPSPASKRISRRAARLRKWQAVTVQFGVGGIFTLICLDIEFIVGI